MKKLLAVLIAIMMLAMPVAFAQEVFTFADPVLSMGELGELDLTGLELNFAGGTVGDATALKLFINSTDGTLFTVDANVVGETVLLTASGLSSVYSIAIPANVTDKLDLSNFQIPDEVVEEIGGIVMQSIEFDEENGTMRIPYTAVNDILEKVAPYLEQLDIPGLNIEEVTEGIAKLKENNSGIDLVGAFTTEEDGSMAVDFSAFVVENGVFAETAAFEFALGISDTGFVLSVNLGDQGTLEVSFESGALYVALTQDATVYSLTGKVGTTEADVEFVELDAANAVDIESLGEEDMAKIGEELMTGASGLISFLMSAMSSAAA